MDPHTPKPLKAENIVASIQNLLRKITNSYTLDTLFRFIIILVVMMNALIIIDAKRVSTCQTRYNTAIAQRQLALNIEVEARDKALANLGMAIANPARPIPDYQKYIEEFSQAASNLETARHNTPLPKPPNTHCT